MARFNIFVCLVPHSMARNIGRHQRVNETRQESTNKSSLAVEDENEHFLTASFDLT